MAAEEPILATQYSIYLQPVMAISILLGIYSLTVTTKTLHAVAPGNKYMYLFKGLVNSFVQ